MVAVLPIAGLVASSSAQRLKPHAIDIRVNVDPVHCFLSRQYLKNASRVLLTRARQGMAIFVPPGATRDRTRKPDFYAGGLQLPNGHGRGRGLGDPINSIFR
jgi:hypothetical protein